MNPEQPTRNSVHRALSWAKAGLAAPRLMLAIKAAIAVGIAWFVAGYMPGVVDDYPYYAPLGALVSMYPTLMGSAKAGFQTLLGLLIGILLAGVIVLFAEPNLLTISLVVGVAVLVSGLRWLGHGKDYVPMAALFVLIIGGQDIESYSIGYAVQMAVGVGCGLLVNAVILPPLNFNAAVLKLSRFRSMLARHLEGMADALTEEWPPEPEKWTSYNDELSTAGHDVREAVYQADESRKGNPRAKLHRRNLSQDYRDLRALESVSFHVKDITDTLAGVSDGGTDPLSNELPTELLQPVSVALRGTAEILKAWESGSEIPARWEEAEQALSALFDQVDAHGEAGAAALSPASSVATAVRRILDTLQPCIKQDAEAA
ncbi:FUSC family protein [Crystallibacter degradans]|uniref:FUSC family protein n=1 Tax=Crystallibacter degradans TaxID=2726743 RepID=UPI001474D728|nr:FUSC family protein [Arthrobacter sp. SF27]NMR32120.1 FUSC family protein [Arthrobacter sp. SF27]